MKFIRKILTLISLSLPLVHAMEVKVIGNTVVMSGAVAGDEYSKVKDAFLATPGINLIILRNSYGGDAKTGYLVGEFFRERGMRTAVSGYCISSCSRMFLGGKQRLFTNDYPDEKTYIGFHGHYDKNHKLDTRSVSNLGLYSWILKYSDGKADEALVERWVNIEHANGMVAFMHPDAALKLKNSTFFCLGTEQARPAGCEPLANVSAMDLGVVTEILRIASPDQNTLPEKQRAKKYPTSDYALISDITKVPLELPLGLENYRKFLMAPTPKAFAVSSNKKAWAWNSGLENVNELALQRCEERAKQSCVLYAVDEFVVFKP